MKRENDQTQNVATPALIVAAIRSGGTFLAHCLSNHTQIFCDRGEPLHQRSLWVRALRPDRRRLLAALLNQTGYQVSMCKITYNQAFKSPMWEWIAKRKPLVVWLRRENVVRQAVSVLINKQARGGKLKRAQHTFSAPRPIRVSLEPKQVLQVARGLRERDKWAKIRVARMKVCLLTYAEIVGGELASAERLPDDVATRLCAFLDVRFEDLGCDLRRVNPYPLSEMLSNWPAVRAAIRRSEFAGMLADE